MVGVHILFPEEVEKASKLINSSGGDWGYVTIPIQIADRDLERWEKFMAECKKYHVIPILRLSTEPFYKNTSVWRIPNEYDIVDQANFLNSLSWPTENRYIIVFNETNRFDEWGGSPPDPKAYADILDFTIDAFKKRNNNFYVIMGGLDNAAPQEPTKYLDSFYYLRQIAAYKPELFNKIDAFSSHSYPNPNFAEPPNERVMGVSTYLHEFEYINFFATSKKPVFITETGWNSDVLSEDTISQYYTYSFNNLWNVNADKIVAVTPFLLESHGGFDKFSFFKNGIATKYYGAVAELPKIKGEPMFNTQKNENQAYNQSIYLLNANSNDPNTTTLEVPPLLKFYFKALLGVLH